MHPQASPMDLLGGGGGVLPAATWQGPIKLIVWYTPHMSLLVSSPASAKLTNIGAVPFYPKKGTAPDKNIIPVKI